MDPLTALAVAGNIIQFVDFGYRLISNSYKLYESTNGALVENLELEAIAESVLELNVKVKDSLGIASQITDELVFKKRYESYDHNYEEEDAKLSALDRLRRTANAVSQSRREDKEEEQLKQLNRARRENDKAIRYICEQCVSVADELVHALEKLKVQGTFRKWKSFRQALQSIWDDGKIEALAQRLEKLRGQLNTGLLVALRIKIDETATQNSDVLAMVGDVQGNTQIIRDKLLGHIEHNQRWQADLISAIYQRSWQAKDEEHLQQFSNKLHGIAEAQWIDQLQLKLLNRLQFPGMTDRKARIADVHRGTFEWIYRDPEVGCKPWSNFVKWLGSEEDIYWITGKPGSGKSTLMKYLYANPHTWRCLRAWSKDCLLISSGFFFWNSGSEMQMSSMGLLRTLLFNCLHQQQNLIPLVFPERWQAYEQFGEDLHPWSWSELLQAFKYFTAEAAKTCKIIFFIDGLDEFKGDHQELIALLQEVAKQSNVKMCLASRPWVVFEDSFGQLPSLMLQDLTYPDIKMLIEDKLVGHPRFCQLKTREPEYALELIMEITTKSAGVFLWITLVVNSLLEGLANSDRISDLKRRLQLMPDDLDGLYRKILKSLDPFYFEHASQLFQIVRQASEPLSLFEISLADEEDTEIALKSEVIPFSQEEKTYRCEAMKRRLNSRCKGLLEVPALQPNPRNPYQLAEQHHAPVSLGFPQDLSPPSGLQEIIYAPDELASLKVEYLHRTVKDFLQNPDNWSMIKAATTPTFDPSLSLSRAFLMRLKDHNQDKLTGEDNIWRAVTCCWNYSTQASPSNDVPQMLIQRELERVVAHLEACPNGTDSLVPSPKKIKIEAQLSAFLRPQQNSTSLIFQQPSTLSRDKRVYLSFNEQCAIYQSVQSQLGAGYLVAVHTDGRPLLSLVAVNFEPFAVLRMRLLILLLQCGISPNQRNETFTPWQDVLNQATADANNQQLNPCYKMLMPRWAEVVELFLKFGAHIEVSSKVEGVECLREVFWRWDAARTQELEKLVQTRITGKRRSRLSHIFSSTRMHHST